MAGQRKDYLKWREYFMSIVALSSLRSKYNNEGACIVDKDNKILSVGYSDVPFNIKRNSSSFDMDKFEVSSLENAIYTFRGSRREFEKGSLYLSSFPDCDQSRQIAQAHFGKVIYLNKTVNSEEFDISNIILDKAGVKIEPYFDDKYSLDEYKNFLVNLKGVIKKNIGKIDSNVLVNEEYFMGLSLLSALRSKDPSTQVGSCLVSSNGCVLSIGYNGAPYNMSDDFLPWHSNGEVTGDLLTTKDPYVVHSEINVFDAYKGSSDDFIGGSLYLLYSPCEKCSKRISFEQLDKIIYLREYTKNGVSKISRRWLRAASINEELYNPLHNYTKEECSDILNETTKVIKKSL